MTLRRINHGRGHSYRIDGDRVDGVTTLIKDGLPKPALVNWAARSVAEHVADNLDAVLGMRDMGRDAIVAALKEAPWTSRNQAGARGTEVHSLAERLTAGEEVAVPDHIAGHVEACIAFLDEWKVRPVLTETVVGSRRWRYGGTLDLVADVTNPATGEEQRIIADWKTTASGIWPETAYQLAAYRHAEVYVDDGGEERPMADLGITDGLGIHIRADGYDAVPVRCDEPVFKAFLHIAWVARHAKDNRSLIGEAVQV